MIVAIHVPTDSNSMRINRMKFGTKQYWIGFALSVPMVLSARSGANLGTVAFCSVPFASYFACRIIKDLSESNPEDLSIERVSIRIDPDTKELPGSH